MSNILVVTGSVRPNSTNEKIVPVVTKRLEKKNAAVSVADLGSLVMPFFDAPVPPTAPEFEAPHESVKTWTKMVADADGVVFVTPEYNHTMTPIQINAVDWIGKEWEGKPIAFVGYGWTTGGGQAQATAKEALGVNLKADIVEPTTNLFFTKQLNPDGTIADEDAVNEMVDATIVALLEKVS